MLIYPLSTEVKKKKNTIYETIIVMGIIKEFGIIFSKGKTIIYWIILEFTKYIDNYKRKSIKLKNVPFGSKNMFTINLTIKMFNSQIFS